jgi:hypothetical protein
LSIEQKIPGAGFGSVAEIGAITSLLTAAGNGLLRRFDADDAHDADGYATAAAWLAAKTHLGRKDAKAAVRQMRLLGSSPAPKRFFESHQAAARRLAGVCSTRLQAITSHCTQAPASTSAMTSMSSSGKFLLPRSGDRTSPCTTAPPTTCAHCRLHTSG